MLKKINKKLLAAVLLVCISAIVYSCQGADDSAGDGAENVVFLDENTSEDTGAVADISEGGDAPNGTTSENDHALSENSDGLSSDVMGEKSDQLTSQSVEDVKSETSENANAENDVTSDVTMKKNGISEDTQESAGQASQSGQQIIVYVCGKVNHPGVYTLEAGARIVDAVDAAGGMTKDAGTDALNLAEWIADGDRIYVPDKAEAAAWGSQSQVLSHSGTTAGQESNAQTSNTSGNLSDSSKSEADADLVNINTADKELLMTLPGIGAAKAEKIIKYRENYGMFASKEALMNVPGIKTGVYESLKDFITVDK